MIFTRERIDWIRGEAGRRLGSRGQGRGARPRLGLGDPGGGPLSFLQARFWSMERSGSGGAALVIPVIRLFEGRVDADRMAAALDWVSGSHPALRTRIVQEPGGPARQVVDAAPRPGFDAARAGASLPEGEALAAAEAFFAAGFSLAREHPLRALLIGLEGGRSLLGVAVHHIAFDGFHSLEVFLADLSLAYRQEPTGAPRPAEGPGYLDFCRWQREMAAGGHFREGLSGWKEELGTLPREPLFPPAPAAAGPRRFLAVRETVSPGPEDAHRLAEIQARLAGRVTAPILHLGLCALALSAATGRRDFAVGTTVSGRPFAGLNRVVGLFINTLPLRIRLAADATGAAFLEGLAETYRAALSRQDAPFELVAEECRPPGGRNAAPLFQVLFDYKPFPAAGSIGGIPCRIPEISGHRTHYDLSIWAIERGGGLRYALDFRADAFPGGRRDPLLASLRRVLRDFGADSPIGPLLAGEGRADSLPNRT